MPHHNLQKSLQALSPMLNHIVTEPVRKDLAGQRWDSNARRFPLQNVAKILKVGIAAAHAAVSQLESGDVRAAEDLVVCVHVAAHAMGSGVLHLGGCQ